MGGPVEIVSSVLGFASGMMRGNQSGGDSSLRKEREAQEKEQQRKEAEERRHNREQLQEARDLKRRRESEKEKGQSLLSNGGAGITSAPTVDRPVLKQKLGE
ncbi:MAG: hypothetical protein CL942_11665 [Desulfovibrio sp.]|nr:hypothetical protein [Desulfovibrio sp.]|tara:strand:- start:4446 stop:4751 length:306 start_codon:yes stop_codon:yes gene_type:complete